MTVRNLIKLAIAIPVAGMLTVSCNNSNKEKEKEMTSKNPPTEAESKATKAKKGKASVGTMTSEKNKMMKDKTGVYNKAEVMPTYPGGESSLSSYVSDHINYDSQSLESDQQGTVMVSFVVDEKGDIVNPKVENSTTNNQELNQEALRVVREMPDWKPGTIKGKAVKTRMYLPITFRAGE